MNETDASTERSEPSERRASWISLGFEHLVTAAIGEGRGCASDPWDVLIVGSGYGGSMAAAALAGAKSSWAGDADPPISVCVLERGQEYLEGSFPNSVDELAGHVRFSRGAPPEARGQLQGLFDVRMGADLNVLVANGLGGGSLINAGVMLEPRAEVLAQGFPGIDAAEWKGLFGRARGMLGAAAPGDAGRPNAYAEERLPAKARALKKLAGGHPFGAVPITVALEARPSSANVKLNACKECGDCATGCNHGAKDSLDVNLLARAARRGARIYTGGTVVRLERAKDSSWIVHAVPTDRSLRNRHGAPTPIHARHVILAAGSLGSTEILMRSQRGGLRFSERLGRAFSSNGDMISVVYDGDDEANAVANECTPPDERGIGPTITSMIDLRGEARGPCAIQEMAVPGALRRVFEEIFTTANTFQTLAETDRTTHGNEPPGAQDPCAVDPRAIRHSSVLAVMGDDGAQGTIELAEAAREEWADGAVTIHWPELRSGPAGTRDQSLFDGQTAALEGLLPPGGRARVLSNPVWRLLPKGLGFLMDGQHGPPLTVHPLGGCAMADSIAGGVVNSYGQVFDPGAGPRGVYASLAVLDGAVIPRALGINPALTISAVALRAVEKLRSEWGFEAPAAQALPESVRPVFAQKSHNTSDPRKHTFEIAERLSGPATIALPDCVAERRFVEITLHYRPCALGPLMRTLDRRVAVLEHPAKSRVRVFESREAYLEACRPDAKEPDREKRLEAIVLYRGELAGHLDFLHREASFALERIARAFVAWLWNRGVRDIFSGRGPSGVPGLVKSAFALASRAGEARLFEYHLRTNLRRVERDPHGVETGEKRFDEPCVIEGRKRLTYGIDSNLFEQVETLELTRFNRLRAQGTLDIDLGYFAEEHTPLLRVEEQPNMPASLIELAAFMAYIARVMITIHVWSFRRPDPRPPRPPQRLPGPIERSTLDRLAVGFKSGWFDPRAKNLGDRIEMAVHNAWVAGSRPVPAPECTELKLEERFGRTVRIRLTRYRCEEVDEPPVLMIHGYSASGTTYAHSAVQPSLAEYLWYRKRDVWILDLRTSSGLETAGDPWTFEDAALNDIPAAVAHVLRETGKDKVDVVAHCMGAAMLAMAVLKEPDASERFYTERMALPGWIRCAVLSQVGPLMQFSPINVLRAYVMRYVQHYLGYSRLEFRVPEDPTLGEQLLDRFLSSLRYPPDERDWENYWFWQDNSFVGTRHRIDWLYGRSFSIRNLDRGVLAELDDFFGPLNFQTALQTQHFALGHTIANRRGDNCYVNRERRDKRWTFPTLSLHGKDNGLMDVATRNRIGDYFNRDDFTHELLQAEYVEQAEFEGTGHQDSLIGKPRTTMPVFERIHRFISRRHAAIAPRPRPNRWAVMPPWGGPVRAPGLTKVSFAVAWDPVLDAPDFALCVTVKRGAAAGRYTRAPIAATYAKADLPCGVFAFAVLNEDGWLKIDVPDSFLAPQGADGFLLLLGYDQSGLLGGGPVVIQDDKLKPLGDDRRRRYRDAAGNDAIPVSLPQGVDGVPPGVYDMLKELNSAGPMEGRIDEYLASAKDDLDDAFVAGYFPPPGGSRLVRIFAGSCQYPNGLMDETVAWRSYERLGQVLDTDEGDPSRRMLILLGDQIYADATAGLFDPALADDRYRRPHLDLLNRPEVRRVLRKLPVVTMLDDHELHENWEPAADGALSDDDRDALRDGVRAYRNYQRYAGPPFVPDPKDAGNPFLWFETKAWDVPIFVANTRTERRGRDLRSPDRWSMMGDEQLAALEAWLGSQPPGIPKIVASPALLLPRRLSTGRYVLDAPRPEALHEGVITSDSWEGFPVSMKRVLAAIADKPVRNVIFLSGDEHMFMAAAIRVRNARGGDWVEIRSIHASPLYAPYPFANAEKADFLGEDRFTFAHEGNTYECEVCGTEYPDIRQGFAEIRIGEDPSGGWNAWFDFHDAASGSPVRWQDLPCASAPKPAAVTA